MSVMSLTIPPDLAAQTWITTAQVAKLLQVSPFTVREWNREGVGPPCVQRGGYNGPLFFEPGEVKKWADGVYFTSTFRRKRIAKAAG